MPASESNPSYLPWIVVAVLAYMLWQKPADNPSPPAPINQSVEQVTKAVFTDMRSGYAAAFGEAAKQVEDKGLATDRQLLEFVRPKVEEARKNAQSKFDAMVEANIPEKFESASEVAAVADFLKRVARSW
jgi:hypothetical protein